MAATTRCRSSRAASLFNEQFDTSTASDTVPTGGPLVEGVEEGRIKGIVVGIFKFPPPEAPVGADEGVEGVEDAVELDERVGDEFGRLGSYDSV